MPKKLEKVPALEVGLAGDDGGVFLGGDGALVLEDRFGSLQGRDDRFKQPLHAHAVAQPEGHGDTI